MPHTPRHTRWIAAGLATAMALALVAPVAEAGGRGGKRWKGNGAIVRNHSQGVVYAQPRYGHRHDSAAPLLVGLVGGYILGTATAGSRDRGACVQAVEYRYVDPYCGSSYASIDDYWGARYSHRHPRVLRVIDVRHDTCVQTIRYDGRRWNDCSDEYWDEWDD